MLTITANITKNDILPYCRECKIPFNNGLYLYTVQDKGELLATGLFEIEAGHVSFLYYFAVDISDIYLFDGVLRAGFHYASEHDVNTGIIPDEVRLTYHNTFSKLNYPNDSVFNIENFFTKYKNCSPR